jgi:hypothetical protein
MIGLALFPGEWAAALFAVAVIGIVIGLVTIHRITTIDDPDRSSFRYRRR